jgi:hypothetical protein
MFHRFRFSLAVAVCLCPAIHAAEPGVDVNAVRRMGDTVQHETADGGFRHGAAEGDFYEAVALPPDDVGKYFISVLYDSRRSYDSGRELVTRWRWAALCESKGTPLTTQDACLLAFGNPDKPSASWAHLNFYDMRDPTQARRFANVKIEAYPYVILQPPRDGNHDATYSIAKYVYRNDADKMATYFTRKLREYTAVRAAERYDGGFQSTAVDGEGFGAAPWDTCPNCPYQPPQQPIVDRQPILPLLPKLVDAVPDQAKADLIQQLFMIGVSAMAGSVNWVGLAGVGFGVWHWLAARRAAAGKPAVPDEVISKIETVVNNVLQATQKPPAA